MEARALWQYRPSEKHKASPGRSMHANVEMKKMVSSEGFEPSTYRLKVRCSTS